MMGALTFGGDLVRIGGLRAGGVSGSSSGGNQGTSSSPSGTDRSPSGGGMIGTEIGAGDSMVLVGAVTDGC